MKWTRLVVRPDALIRFWCISGFQPGPSYAEASGIASFKDATLTSHVFLSDGSTHVRLDELADLYELFWRLADGDPSLPGRLAKHYVEIGERWVAHCAAAFASTKDLGAAGDEDLGRMLDEFCALYEAYAPALYLPFAVERKYAEQFPALLSRITQGARDGAVAAIARESADLAPLLVQDLASLELAIRPILEQSTKRTNAERKDAVLNRLADGLEAQGWDRLPETVDDLRESSPALYDELLEAERDYGWIGQWGYPPRYSATSLAGLYEEAAIRVKARARQSASANPESGSPSREELLDLANASPADRALIEDFSYYNFYRTYRMELLIRAQYLSTPLLEEIGRRTNLSAEQYSLLTPPEFRDALLSPEARESALALAEERGDGWILEASGLDRVRKVHSGAAFTRQRAAFLSVLRAGENARGEADMSDPAIVGGKGAGLARLLAGGFDVPDYCVLTIDGVRRLQDPDQRDVTADVLWDATRGISGTGLLAVRSSASVEDGSDQSWAGRFDSVLGVKEDRAALVDAVEQVVASQGSSRVAAYAERVGRAADDIAMAVIVQRQVDADLAGVMNTSVSTPEGTCTEIEVVAGLGDKLVDGAVSPARFTLTAGGNVTRSGANVDVPEAVIAELASLARQVEEHFGSPQDVEFAVSGGTVHLLQSRPLTGPGATPTAGTGEAGEVKDGIEIVSGLSGHVAARVTGAVAMPDSPDAGQKLPDGRVLVLRAATPVWDSVVFQAAALVTDEGGSTSHAIRVANELGIPAVVGTRIATRSLRDGDTVVVDTACAGSTGRVFR